jgi:hypothetical protein
MVAPRKLMATPITEAGGFPIQEGSDAAAAAAAAAGLAPELPTDIPSVGNLPFFKAEDAQYFARILKEEDKARPHPPTPPPLDLGLTTTLVGPVRPTSSSSLPLLLPPPSPSSVPTRNTTAHAFSVNCLSAGHTISTSLPKGLAKAIGFIIPLMDPEYASYYTKEVTVIPIRES